MIDSRPAQTDAEDHVILVEPDGSPRGFAPRATVHSRETPLHLAFSCYVIREDARVLLTRRALTKRTWPGVWTNSFCGHPRRGESFAEAIARHAQHELGMRVRTPEEALPDFRYRAVDASGIVENEICPVFLAVADGEAAPNPAEVMDLRWVAPAELASLVELSPWTLSPWTASQVPQLRGILERVPASAP
ncbi:isopentenyl-diphosphate delta-isomerase [Brachybacterium vulturis]|uniref:Isopentenyl-diphosphate Delta-isomerase n=1 Tax=Brachybacterium vulturis TaxID=2017484 RepID=A0A291GJD6_9MICO|nr:isopentenyl-diphosphate Delta-isomerase [Brachybacterium vulturis]ATG50162.1 isopentenyl-diphosphate delta-isomerase [Brachybacterium vulturis]